MSAMALFAAQRGMQTGQGMADAFKQQMVATLQGQLTDLRMAEVDRRADTQVKNTFQAAEKVQAAQISAITKSGVTLEGSSMEVLSDTLSHAAEAAHLARREADFDLIQMGMDRAALRAQSSNSALVANLAVAGLGGAVNFAADKQRLKAKGKAKGLGGIE